MIYIPSTNRADLAEKTLRAFRNVTKEPIAFVIEKSDRDAYRHLAAKKIVLGKERGGIAYVRQRILLHAERSGAEFFITADDDVRPADDPVKFYKILEKKGFLGVGGYLRIYKMMIAGSEDKKLTAVSGSLGHVLLGLSVQNLLELGGYWTDLTHHGEDTEIVRENIVQRAEPWFITNTVGFSQGARYVAGGLGEKTSGRGQGAWDCMMKIHRKWGADYVTAPRWVNDFPRQTVRWKRLMQDHAPEWMGRIYK